MKSPYEHEDARPLPRQSQIWRNLDRHELVIRADKRRLPDTNHRSTVMRARLRKVAGSNFTAPEGMFAVAVDYLRSDGKIHTETFRFGFRSEAKEFALRVARGRDGK